jgi:hypothetical protein
MMLSDAAEIRRALQRFRDFGECLLHELRLIAHGRDAELVFHYIWDDSDRSDSGVLEEPRVVTMTLTLVETLVFNGALNHAMIAAPENINWGLSEVALVKLASTSDLPTAGGEHAVFHRLVIAWESDRRIEITFRGFDLTE